MSKQKHVRFDASKVDRTLDPAECRKELVLGSVAESSQPQYRSRLNTLTDFLRTWRQDPDPDVVTTTEDEFMCFLKSWKTQGLGDPEETRSALLQLQRAMKVDAWAASKTVMKAVVGATGVRGPDKLVLDDDMISDYESFIMNAELELLGPCRDCRMLLDTIEGREVLVWANRLMQEVGIRLCNLLDLLDSHLNAQRGELYIPRLKQAGGGPGFLPCSAEGQEVIAKVQELAGDRRRGYLFPKCVQKHLNASLREAGTVFGWEPGLVHTAYCLRHTGMRQKKKRVEAELQAVANEKAVTVQTASHYSRPNEKRRKAE